MSAQRPWASGLVHEQSVNAGRPWNSRGPALSESSNQPCPRNGSSRARDHGQSASAFRKGSDGSVDRHPARKRLRRGQSTRLVNPRPSRGNGLSASTNVHGLLPFRVREPGLSATDPSVARFKPNRIDRMSSFDPASVRQAVAEFTPRRPQRFQELAPAKEVIAELRQKRASYRAIAELLTQHCLPISKTAVAAFCHEVLGEIVRPRRRPGRKRMASTSSPIVETVVAAAPATTTEAGAALPPSDGSEVDQTRPARPRGPRIAQVRMVTTPST